MYSGLKKYVPFLYNTQDFINDAKSNGVDEILMKLEIEYTGCGCCSGTENTLVLFDLEKRVKRHKSSTIRVKGLGYTSEEYCKITHAAEQLRRELGQFRVIYDAGLTNIFEKCKDSRSRDDLII